MTCSHYASRLTGAYTIRDGKLISYPPDQFMNLIALQKLIQKWNELAELARGEGCHTASMAYSQAALDLAHELEKFQTQPADTTP